MKVARAITEGMRADRARDLQSACLGGWGLDCVHLMQAWCWWGWDINGHGGMGRPGYSA